MVSTAMAEVLGLRPGSPINPRLDRRDLTMPEVAVLAEHIDHDEEHIELDLTGSNVGLHAAPLLLNSLGSLRSLFVDDCEHPELFYACHVRGVELTTW